jgi:hypothetical protein
VGISKLELVGDNKWNKWLPLIGRLEHLAPTIHQFKATHEKQATIINDIMVAFINMADDPNY